MSILLTILLLAILAILAFQDFKEREISLFLLLLLAVLLMVRGIISVGLPELKREILLNWSFLFIQLFLLTTVYTIKNRGFKDFTKNYIGWGDIVFYAIIALLLPLANYVLFFIVGLITTLIAAFAIKHILKTKFTTIPLAGSLALQTGLLICFDSFQIINLANYNWLFTLTLLKSL